MAAFEFDDMAVTVVVRIGGGTQLPAGVSPDHRMHPERYGQSDEAERLYRRARLIKESHRQLMGR